MTSKNRAAGFTMMELVMVIAIAGLLAAIGIPSFKYVTASNRIATELNALVGDLQFARSEAVKEGLPVTVCASTDGISCANSSTWNTGWIVFADSNGNKAVDANETVLRVQKNFTTTGSTDTLVASNAAFQAVVFNREGYAATSVAAVVNVALHSSPVNNQWTRCLAVTPVGALTVVKYGVGTPSCT
jgi:type IV fimbrial biogenesis protein FimT